MRRFLALPVALVFVACGGESSTPLTPATPTITLSASAEAVNVVSGNNTTISLTVARSGGFAGDVALTASGTAAGVTVTFSPATIGMAATSSVVTIAVAAAAVASTNTITISASGTGVTSRTVTVALTTVIPAITLSAGSNGLSVVAGTSGTVPLTIARLGGYTGDVNLTASGLPAGVTASFAPTTLAGTATSSTMTLTAVASASSPAAAVTITAAGTGVTSQSATVSLAVTAAPDFALTAAPASVSIVAGQTGSGVVTITRSGGFAGNVNLTLEGAPTGVMAAFAPNPATAGTSTLTLSSTAAAVVGTVNLTVRGTATGLSDRTTTIVLTMTPAPAIAVSVPSTLTVTAGAIVTTPVTITRVGNFTGDVALTLENAPAGVTGVFTPTPLTGTTTTSSLAITVPANATAGGPFTVTVRAAGTGVTPQTASVALTIVGGYSLAATNVSTPQGTTGTSTVTLTRTGGFAGTVNLAISGLPSGVTATFTPAGVTGTTSSLALAVAASVAPGTYSAGVIITGTATGLANVTTPLTLIVTQASGVNVDWRFCGGASVPVWFAFRDGTNGTWTRVTPSANNTFSFNIAESVGGVAWVTNPVVGNTVTMYFQSASELNNTAAQSCLSDAVTKTVTGSVANVPAGQSVTVDAGNTSAGLSAPATAFTLNNMNDGLTDLVATRTTSGRVPDKMILRRSINPAANSTMAVLDFSGSEAFAPGTAVYTFANGGTDALSIVSFFLLRNVGSYAFTFSDLTGGNTGTGYGLPNNKTQDSDLHYVRATAFNSNANSARQIIQYNRDLVDRTVPFGAQLNGPTVTSVGTPTFARLKIAGTLQSDYLNGLRCLFFQSDNLWSLRVSKAFLGSGTNFDFDVPDLSRVSGFLSSWALVGGVSIKWTVEATSGSANFTPSDGATIRFASRSGLITP